MSETLATGPVDTGDAAPAGAPAIDQDAIKAAVEKARQEEKDKLYARISKMEEGWNAAKSELEQYRSAQEQQAEIARKAQEKADAEARAKAESEMSAKELLATRESEWQKQMAEQTKTWEERFNGLQAQREQELALLEKEREFASLRDYAQTQISASQNEIAPELIDLIGGNSKEEIDASIANMKERTASIVEAMRTAAQQQRAQMRGTAPTGFSATGPLDTNSSHQTLSPADIAGMSMSDYAKNRGALLGASSQANNRGLFG